MQAQRILDFTGDALPKPSSAFARAMSKVFEVVLGIKGTFPQPKIGTAASITDFANTASSASNIPAAHRKYTERKKLCIDIDNMDRGDEIISRALDIVAEHALAYEDDTNYRKNEKPGDVKKINRGYEQGFRVVSDNPEVQQILDDLITRLDLRSDSGNYSIVRNFVKYGTYLPEVLVSEKDPDTNERMIIGLGDTEPFEIWPNINEKGRKIPGWIYKRDRDVFGATNGLAMEEWQILPFFFGPRTGFFTQPMLSTCVYTWKKLMQIEDHMGEQRLRSADLLVHRVPVSDTATADQIKNTLNVYKQAMTKRSVVGPDQTISLNENPRDATSEIFMGVNTKVQGSVEQLSPSNAHLSNLTDVNHILQRILVRLGVPIAYLQISTLQKTHLTAAASGVNGVEKAFNITLRRVQDCLRHGLMRLFDMELKLHGITPVAGLYSIELPKISTRDAAQEAKTALQNAQAAVYMVEAFGSLPGPVLAELYLNLTSEQQATMSSFFDKWDDKITAARIKALQTAAMPKPMGGSSSGGLAPKNRVTGKVGGKGNNNKSLAARSSEQKGAAQSMVLVEDVKGIFDSYKESLKDMLMQSGVGQEELAIIEDRDVLGELNELAQWADDFIEPDGAHLLGV